MAELAVFVIPDNECVKDLNGDNLVSLRFEGIERPWRFRGATLYSIVAYTRLAGTLYSIIKVLHAD